MDLAGQLLIAMPGMGDPRFARSVVLVCTHDDDGAMGLVLTQPVASPSFADVLEELKIEPAQPRADGHPPVLRGGPVEQGRGFMLHTLDCAGTATTRVGDDLGLTTTVEILRRAASEDPPRRAALYLGYAGWSANQLEAEIAANGWLTLEAAQDIVFTCAPDRIYTEALARLGVSEAFISDSAGHA